MAFCLYQFLLHYVHIYYIATKKNLLLKNDWILRSHILGSLFLSILEKFACIIFDQIKFNQQHLIYRLLLCRYLLLAILILVLIKSLLGNFNAEDSHSSLKNYITIGSLYYAFIIFKLINKNKICWVIYFKNNSNIIF